MPKYCFLLLFLLTSGCAARQSSVSIYNEQADAHHDVAAAISTAEGN
jgi:hypothetical protein